MEEIFKRIKDRKWDWFGWGPDVFLGHFYFETSNDILSIKNGQSWERFSLADLLSNPSFCIALWGNKSLEMFKCATDGRPPKEMFEYMMNRMMAFEILSEDGKQACLDHIKKTMQ